MECDTINFVNELGNRIVIAIKNGQCTHEVVVSIIGPTSETTNTITLTEAIQLHRLLGNYINRTAVATRVGS